MLKVGLIGCGGISASHIPAWEAMEDVILVAVCDTRPEMMKNYSEKHCYTEFDDMLEHEALDILDICLPTYLHAEYAIKAMEKGIHVICEKPISLCIEDIDRIYQTAQKNSVKFMVAQVLRFWPEYDYVKQLFDSKKYGRLLSGSMSRLNICPRWSWNNWMREEKCSGLVPFDLHIHDLDFMVYAFGSPRKVNAYRSRQSDQDCIAAVYEFEDFFIFGEAAWYAAPYPFKASFRFQFESAVVECDGRLIVREKDGTVFCPFEEAVGEGNDLLALPKTDAYASEIRYFTDCVKNNTPVDKVDPEELKYVLDTLSKI